MPPKGKGKKTPRKAATLLSYEDSVRSQENDVVQVGKKFPAFDEQLGIFLDEEDSTNFCGDINAIFTVELANYNEVGYQHTLLQYNHPLVKVYVCRPVAVRKEFTKSMPPGDLSVIERCSDNYL